MPSILRTLGYVGRLESPRVLLRVVLLNDQGLTIVRHGRPMHGRRLRKLRFHRVLGRRRATSRIISYFRRVSLPLDSVPPHAADAAAVTPPLSAES